MIVPNLVEGKTVIVTGASRGIGQATARAMLLSGANVVVNAREDNTALEETVAHLREIDENRFVVSLGDVSGPDYAPALAARAKDHFGGIDVLVNNAGIIRDQALGFMQEADWEALLHKSFEGFIL